MDKVVRLSTAASNIALASICKLMSGGCLYIFAGEPGDASQPLVRLPMMVRSFFAPKERKAIGKPIDGIARASGHATWFRLYNKDESITVLEGSVGTEDADLVLTNCDILEGGSVKIKEMIIEQPRDDEDDQ